jgi:cytochrome c-type biogenesis protein CcmH
MALFRSAAMLALVLGLGGATAFAATVTTKEIEESLTCQCGCGLTVHSCNHLQCGSAIPLKQEVATLVEQGLARDAILIRFRDKYGEKILAAPTTEGFNLTAWVLPFVVLGLGIGVVLVTVRRWTGREEAAEAAVSQPAIDEASRRRLDRALSQDEEERS